MKKQAFINLMSAGTLSLLAGCAESVPENDAAIRVLEAQLPVEYKVLQAETEFSRESETSGLLRIKAVVAPQRDTYAHAESMGSVWAGRHFNMNDEIRKMDNHVNELIRNGAPIPPQAMEKHNNAIAGLNSAVKQSNRQVIKVDMKVGTPVEILGKAKAHFEFKAWRIDNFLLDVFPRGGRARSDFPPDAVLEGSEEYERILGDVDKAFAERKSAFNALLTEIDGERKRYEESVLGPAKVIFAEGKTFAGEAMFKGLTCPLDFVVRSSYFKSKLDDKVIGNLSATLKSGRYSRVYTGNVLYSNERYQLEIRPGEGMRDVESDLHWWLFKGTGWILWIEHDDGRLLSNNQVQMELKAVP